VGIALLFITLVVPLACKAPAEFEVISVDITPPEVTAGETVTITAQVRNMGDNEGTYIARLTAEGDELETKEVTLSSGFSEVVTFTLVMDDIGTYNIAVNGSSETLTVVPLNIMKGVNIDIPQEDFGTMRAAGIDILTTQWGMEKSLEKTKAFLDKAEAVGLKVVLDGGFSNIAWGFSDGDWDNLPEGKRPVWQREKVQSWVGALRNHPAVFGWDISNEAGLNFPCGDEAESPEWPDSAITLQQLKQARADVLEIDPDKPILIRMAPWDLSKPPFQVDNPFDAGIADIVMLNVYSNWAKDNEVQFPNIIQESAGEYIRAIKAYDPDAKIWLAMAAFKEPNLFQRPTASDLTRDIRSTLKLPYITGIAFFQWGPAKLRDTGENWYLPETGADLWDVIQHHIQPGPVLFQTTTNPSPRVVDIKVSPLEVHLGDHAEITVEVRNDGVAAEWQTIAVSFPQNPSDVSIIEHDLSNAEVYSPGYIGWRDYGTAQDREFIYPLAEGYKSPWPSGETSYLIVRVKPEASGKFKLYVKSVAGRQPDGECVSWEPLSGARDQQGEFVYERIIRVIPSSGD